MHAGCIDGASRCQPAAPAPCQPLPCPAAPPAACRKNFEGTEWIKVPQVLWEYSAASVLTMEYTPGVKINRGERGGAGCVGSAPGGWLPPFFFLLRAALLRCTAAHAHTEPHCHSHPPPSCCQPPPHNTPPTPPPPPPSAVSELDRMGVDRQLLARRAVESYLQQLLNHGFFHADPHPGAAGCRVGGLGGRGGTAHSRENQRLGGWLVLTYGLTSSSCAFPPPAPPQATLLLTRRAGGA